MEIDKALDATGLKCPLPILKAKRALNQVPVGGLLEVRATDPGSPDDFVAFCDSTGNELVATGEEDGCYRFVIRRVG